MSLPAVFHRIWFGSPVPDDPVIRACLESVESLHPGWTTVWHTEPTLLDHPAFRGLGLRRRWLEIGELDVPPHRMWGYRSDLYRLLVLYVHGGWYLDLDFWAVRPLDCFADRELVLMQFLPGKVGEGVIAAPAGSDRVKTLLAACLKRRVGKVMPPGFGPVSRHHGWPSEPPEVFCPHWRTQKRPDLYRCTGRTHLIHLCHREFAYDLSRLKDLTERACPDTK